MPSIWKKSFSLTFNSIAWIHRWIKLSVAGKSNFKLDVNGAFISNVWETTVETYHSRIYDTQKPKPLLERIIKSSSNEGDVVADFFCGSGTSLVVAKELGRNYIGCDINPRAVEITNQRLEDTDKMMS